MSTITLPNIRVGSDLIMRVRLKDNGVAIDWSTLSGIKSHLYSDAQRALAGRCDVSVDGEDPTLLVCRYAATKMQYLGENRIIVQAQYRGSTKTYDKPVVNFVRWTADTEGEEITIDDPDVDVEIEVEDVSSSILDEAIYAALAAADRANDTADSLAGVEAEVEAAEALRVTAEESRVEAEEGRAEAEAARVDEEAVRVSAEDARVSAENAREAAEDLRDEAEDAREEAEDDRADAEDAREVAEALRVTAEAARVTAEAARESQASADHLTAAADHSQAEADHTQAASDHTTAAADHTQAGADHTLAAADHTRAGEDHTQALADREIVGGYNTRLTAVEGEVSQLEAKLNNLANTRYYGIFTSASQLPADASENGYAYVGSSTPLAIYEFDGEDWNDTGVTVNSIQGEPGVGFYSVESPTPADGTLTITLSNGDEVTLDLNHNHPAYYSKVAETSNPSGGFLPDVAYSLGTLTGTVTFALAAAVTGNVNHYFWMFDTGSTAPTITWPSGITWADGSAPTVAASKHYEISVLNGIAYYSEV